MIGGAAATAGAVGVGDWLRSKSTAVTRITNRKPNMPNSASPAAEARCHGPMSGRNTN